MEKDSGIQVLRRRFIFSDGAKIEGVRIIREKRRTVEGQQKTRFLPRFGSGDLLLHINKKK